MPNRIPAIRLALLTAAALGLCGCGGGRNPVAGEVTRDGQPVPTGVVQFTPDLDKGNKGPTVTLGITGGRFSSARERADVPAGAHIVRVIVAAAGSGGELPSEEHTFPVTVPPGGTSDLKFDVSQRHPGGPKAKGP
jgi:hypothetical protein